MTFWNVLNGVVTTPGVRRIAVLGNHLPRQCGIATFTTDLTDALITAAPERDCFVLAMNDAGYEHAYPPRVRFELPEVDLSSYRRAADYLNVNAVDVLSVQHEYGIFGGKAGSHVLSLLRELRMPIVTTLHTIIATPTVAQRRVMDEITAISERVVVMTAHGRDLLQDVHRVPATKIDLIPHGIPTVPFESEGKDRLGVEGRPMLLTFGLLSPDKGIEHVIDALPTILAQHPDAVYVVLGATHPHVREQQGETYRLMLEARAEQLGVSGSVVFHNRFVSQAELTEFLSAADIYITPSVNPEQITSGTLAYAVGAGKAVISTPYVYARALLAEGRGILVPFQDAPTIAREVVGLLDDPAKLLAMRTRAAEYGRAMRWPAVAKAYLTSFDRAASERTKRRHSAFRATTLAERPAELPEVRLDHVVMKTDDTGILQHAAYSVPRYTDGYCLDDNARALLLMAMLEDAGSEEKKTVRTLASRYLAFVCDALDRPTGRFKNFMSYGRLWHEGPGSEDSHGRALWALGTVVGRSPDPARHSLASELFQQALPAVKQFTSPRAWAYTLLGVAEYLHAFAGDRFVETSGRTLALQLLGLFHQSSHENWPWFEGNVTYCNARLPQALLATGAWTSNADMIVVGERSLDWLLSVQLSPEGYFAPIGSNGFYDRGKVSAAFDQQPVEACAMISAMFEAHRVTGHQRWTDNAKRVFGWYLGQNQLQLPLYDPTTFGCRDALHEDRVNLNQGAESTLSFLLALMEMRADQARTVDERYRGHGTKTVWIPNEETLVGAGS
jgi:glycosyltransferase involved in cell wall biosynthesis